MLKKRYLFLIILVCLFAISTVNAEEIVNGTNNVLSIDNEISIINQQMDNQDNYINVYNDEILSINKGTYSELVSEIGSGGNITLTRDVYTYDVGSPIYIYQSGTIDGNGAIIDMAGSDSYIFNVKTTDVIIKDITFKNLKCNSFGSAIRFNNNNGIVSNCSFVNNSALGNGGAIYFNSWCYGSVINCAFINNTASGNGGAIVGFGTIKNCYFVNNTAKSGGAIYGPSSVTNCSFVNNSAVGDFGGSGGAIYFVYSSTSTASNCSFVNNTAREYGGAINLNSKNTVNNCSFINNKVLNNLSVGGAISGSGTVKFSSFVNNSASGGGAIYSSNLTILGSSFVNNVASRNGGAIYGYGFVLNCSFVNNKVLNILSVGGAIYSSNIGVDNCYFVNNSATRYGGAIYSTNSSVDNCYFVNNQVREYGGAIYSTNSSVDNCYFVNNQAREYGGAVYSKSNNSILNCSFINNNAPSGGAVYSKSNNSILNCSFINNNASSGGAISGSGTVKFSSFVNNSATMYGGAIAIGEEGVVVYCSFINNSAIYGSAIRSYIARDFNNNWWGSNNPYWESLINNLNIPTNYAVLNVTATTQNITTESNAKLNYGFFKNGTNEMLSIPCPKMTIKLSSDGGYIKNTSGYLINGKFLTEFSSDREGIYEITAKIDDEKIKIKINVVYEPIIPKENVTISIYAPEVIEGENTTITLSLSSDATGSVTVGNVIVPVKKGKAIVTISNLPVGDTILPVKYSGDDKYNPASTTVKITVNPKPKENLTIGASAQPIIVDQDATVVVTGLKDATGEVTVTVGNNMWNGQISKGTVTVVVTGLKETTTASVIYAGDDKYNPASTSVNIIVLPDTGVIISAPDVTKYYHGSEKFVVTLTDNNDNPLSGQIISILLDGQTYTRTTDDNGQVFIDLELDSGKYDVTTTYNDINVKSTVIINPAPTKTVLSGVKDINVDDSLTVTANVNASVGSVTFKINSKTQTVDIVNNKALYTITGLSEGSYNIIASYGDANGNYLSSSDSASFSVLKVSPKLSVIADDIGEGQDAIFEVTMNDDCTGDISILIDGKTYKNTLSGGKTIIKVPNLTAGDYNYTVSFLGDKQYGPKSVYGTINVKRVNVILNAPDLIKYYGSKDRLSVQLIDKSNKPLFGQKIIFTVNGKDYERITDNLGIASMNVNLISGNHTANVRFEGNGTYNAIKTKIQIEIKSTVSGNNVTKIFRNGTQYYATFVDTNGNLMKNTDVKFNINGVFYTRTTDNNGKAKMNINLPPETYIITAENPNSTEKYTNVITVLPSIVENHDLTKYYKNASKYTLRILGDDGKPVGQGVDVKLNINGVFYTRTTDASGYMSMNINLPPGKYTVTAEYNGLRASNTITVLPILETKDLKMSYKDGSKFEAKILDGQGKPYAGQTVTFNINGVFYQKTTGDDGVARLSINLMAGEYIITSTYNGLNAANKVTISG